MTPEETIKAFIKDMNSWENWAHENTPKNPNDREYESFKQELNMRVGKIFKEYCTSRDRSYGRNGMYQKPPEYQENEEILEVIDCSNTRIEIITQEHSGFSNKNKYTLLKQGGRWLIDNKTWFDVQNSDWSRGTL